jgi:cytochrome c1
MLLRCRLLLDIFYLTHNDQKNSGKEDHTGEGGYINLPRKSLGTPLRLRSSPSRVFRRSAPLASTTTGSRGSFGTDNLTSMVVTGFALDAMAEPPELFRLKCACHRYPGDTNSTHFRRKSVGSPPDATTVQQDRSRFTSHEGEFTIAHNSSTFKS